LVTVAELALEVWLDEVLLGEVVLLALVEGEPVMETVETWTTVRVVVEVSAAATSAAGSTARTSVEKRIVEVFWVVN
jgi:hypothetical protein